MNRVLHENISTETLDWIINTAIASGEIKATMTICPNIIAVNAAKQHIVKGAITTPKVAEFEPVRVRIELLQIANMLYRKNLQPTRISIDDCFLRFEVGDLQKPISVEATMDCTPPDPFNPDREKLEVQPSQRMKELLQRGLDEYTKIKLPNKSMTIRTDDNLKYEFLYPARSVNLLIQMLEPTRWYQSMFTNEWMYVETSNGAATLKAFVPIKMCE